MKMGDLLNCFLTDYATSYRRLRGLPDLPRRKKSFEKDYETELRDRLHDVLYRLKRDGLVEKSGRDIWRITRKGKKEKTEMLGKNSFPAPGSYERKESLAWNIAIFDIPEKERKKRAWLRAVLRRIGFRMLQQSVWIGKVKLPQNFIEDAGEMKILPHLEILAITRRGSLRQLR